MNKILFSNKVFTSAIEVGYQQYCLQEAWDSQDQSGIMHYDGLKSDAIGGLNKAVEALGGNPLTIDLGLTNPWLYAGANIENVGGRDTLITPVNEAIKTVGTNITVALKELPSSLKAKVVLTGPMAVWSYLIVFHAVVHKFGEVWYDDGRTGPVLVAKH